jgi:hypothetical protein
MKSILSSSLAVVVAAFALQSCKVPEKGEEHTYLYSFEKTPPLAVDQSKELIQNYLDVKDPPDLVLNKDENTVYFTGADVNTTFEQNLTTGNFEFTKFPADYANSVPKLPSGEEATKIAATFLRSHKIYPAKAAELKLVHTGGVREQAVAQGQRAGPVIDKLITLTYGRVLDGTPVIGAGSKIVVSIGDRGEVVGTIHRWRELNGGATKAVRTEEVITKAEAEEQARKQIQMEFGQVPYEVRSSVKSYYDNNGSYLQPVWAFDVRLGLNQLDKNTGPTKYLCIVPMLRNSPEPLNLNAVDPRAKDLIKTVRPNTRNPAKPEGTD